MGEWGSVIIVTCCDVVLVEVETVTVMVVIMVLMKVEVGMIVC